MPIKCFPCCGPGCIVDEWVAALKTKDVAMVDADKTNILIVDDLPDKLLVYKTVLESLDQNLISAVSGEEALRQVLRHDFAVILLDVHMPGMDGFETAALIRQRKKSAHTPIIFVTAFADEMSMAQGYAQGAVDYILAPVVPDILRAKVRVFVDLFRMTQQVKRQAEERIILAEERQRRAAAEESNRRLSFLIKAGAQLGQSLDYDSTVRNVARLSVPHLADLAAVARIDLPSGEWQITLAQTKADSPSLEEFVGRERLPEHLGAAVAQSLVTAPGERIALGDGNSPNAHPTTLVLPLQMRGRTLAALALSRSTADQSFSPADIEEAEALAARAAVALDNAKLYKDVQQADRQKNEFLSMLAHELRNPLAPIRNAVEVLRRHGSNQTGLAWARDVIDRQVGHMVRLVDDLLDISRITRGKIRLRMETVNVATFVAHAVEASRPVIEARRHRLSVSLPNEPLWVRGDSARLAQVLTNLLNNAAKYTPEGGNIWLTASTEADSAVISIRDTGVGIPAEMLGTVFDLFTQVDRSLERSEGGLGIGLTLVKRLVEMHSGSVEALSEGPGRGSEFVVRLSLAPIEGPDLLPSGGIETLAPSHSQTRILVVDDNIDGADSLAVLLRLGGHEVSLAHDGPTALDIAQAFHPEIVLLDIGLPGMDGYQVAKRLRSGPATREAILVAVTGYGRDEDRQRSQEAGFDHHLVKPVSFDALRQVFMMAADRPAHQAMRDFPKLALDGAGAGG
jgi:signal transduction histidine kinase/DNA-binding response OmpR family regulator